MRLESRDFDQKFSAWKRFFETGEIDRSMISEEIAQSWKRCREYGVDPYGTKKPIRLSPGEIAQRQQEYGRLLEAAEPFIQLLKAAVQGSGFIITISDREGYVLGVWGDEEIIDMARANNYLPGCRRTEDEVGTNAIGLAFFLRTPVQVTGPEHYNINHHLWTCSSAPICAPDNQCLGAITLSGKSSGVHKHTLGMVVSAAEGIENKIKEQRLARERDNLNSYLDSILNSISEGIIAIDTEGRIIRTNRATQTMLGLQHIPMLGKQLDQVIKADQTVWDRILYNEDLSDHEIVIDVSGNPVFFLCTTAPIRYRGELLGKILILTEKQRFYRLVQRLAGNCAKFTFSDIKGNNPELRRQIRIAHIASQTDSRILIMGESGTGKELFAHAIHNLSPRKNGPFVAVSCATLPRELIEAELFGYREGAFTGAKKGGRVGKFELADKGTLFLDEIALMPLDMQAKLLRALQAGGITRLGDTEPRPIDVRVIAATNQDLFALVQEREFREDLFYRLNVVEIAVPPLRRRMDDLRILTGHILDRVTSQLGLKRIRISDAAFEILRSHDWPGNVRELENYLERACILCESDVFLPEHLPLRLRMEDGKRPSDSVKTFHEEEKKVILSALSESRGNVSQAARRLNISRSTIHRRLKDYGIVRPTRT